MIYRNGQFISENYSVPPLPIVLIVENEIKEECEEDEEDEEE